MLFWVSQEGLADAFSEVWYSISGSSDRLGSRLGCRRDDSSWLHCSSGYLWVESACASLYRRLHGSSFRGRRSCAEPGVNALRLRVIIAFVLYLL